MMATITPERTVWLGFAAVLIVVAVAGVWHLLPGDGPGSTPPVLGSIPDFTLMERSGDNLSRDDLAGEPWIADFIFTRCSGVCPVLSARMADLRRAVHRHGLRTRFVSFTVDPVHDTAEVLRTYAGRYEAGDDWLFVTGDRGVMYDLISLGFRLSVADRSPSQDASDAAELITHSDRFVLVDAAGRVRGYYHGTDARVVPKLLADLRAIQPDDRRTP